MQCALQSSVKSDGFPFVPVCMMVHFFQNGTLLMRQHDALRLAVRQAHHMLYSMSLVQQEQQEQSAH